MRGHACSVEQRLGRALRCLDLEEERLFEQHVARCPACSVAIRQLEGELAWLAMAASPVLPGPDFVQRALARVRE